MRDLYEVLQVHPRAEAEVIRAAYRTLARKYHPDHGGDPEHMIALNDAWDVLGDPERRAAYDATRSTAARTDVSASRAEPSPAGQADTTIKYDPGAPRPTDVTHAGPPPGRPSGSVLNFGRYAGWSLGEVARFDRDYLEWLARSTVGRGLRAELEALLRPHGGPGTRATSGSGNWPGRG